MMDRMNVKNRAGEFLHRNKACLAMLIGLILTIAMTSLVSFAAACQAVREDVLRLHILANSDSAEDQALKLAVRDRVLLEARTLFDGSKSLKEAKALADQHLPTLIAAAQDEVNRRGYQDIVRAEQTTCYFETREYEGFTLPAGQYQAIRFTIGSGQGKNWWCVMFPPMCIPISLEEQPDLSLFTASELRLVQRNPKYEPRFAIIELLSSHQGVRTGK